MKNVPDSVIKFSGGKAKFYEQYRDYWNHSYSLTHKNFTYVPADEKAATMNFSDKETEITKAYIAEIIRMSGITNYDEYAPQVWANHPLVNFWGFAIMQTAMDMILPDVMIQSTGLYADIVNVPAGGSLSVNLKARDLFVVSKSGRAQKMTEMHKQFTGQQTLVPEPHQLTVGVSWYRVICGEESLAELTTKMIRSMESQMYVDIFNGFNTAMGALDNAGDDALRFAGFSESTVLSLCQKIESFNGGAAPLIVGTKVALGSVLPADVNYRYSLEDSLVKLGYLREFKGYQLLELPQVALWAEPFKLALDDTKIYVISPSAQKLMKVVIENSSMAFTENAFDNQNLIQRSTIQKSWISAVCTNAVAGVITLA
jgi:hypothetical protein